MGLSDFLGLSCTKTGFFNDAVFYFQSKTSIYFDKHRKGQGLSEPPLAINNISKLIQEGCYKRNIIETLSRPKAGSPIHKILDYNGCTVPENFFIKTRHEDIHMFEYPNTAIGSTRTRSTKEMLVY